MRYCIHPNCPFPENPESHLFCSACGAQLLLNGRYWATELLATRSVGGFLCSRTFAASDRNSPKILKVLYDTDEWAIARFRREAEVLSQLHHPGLPHVEPEGFFRFTLPGSPTSIHGLVMERIEGLNLLQWLEKRGNRPLTRDEEPMAIDWLQQLAHILAHVHDRGFFHRDIKPSNIMLDTRGCLVAIDFGEVREAGGDEVTVVYTEGYTAPEQHNGFACPQSDFFALGRTFVHLLTGTPPKLLPKNPERGTIWRPQAEISEALADTIDGLMAPLPEDRPQNAGEILARLETIAQNPKAIAGKSPCSQKPKRQTSAAKNAVKTRYFGMVMLGIGAGLALAATAIATFHRFPKLHPRRVISQLQPAPPKPTFGNTMNPHDCPPQNNDNFSCGEEILLTDRPPESSKQSGMQAFKAGNYKLARALFDKARKGEPSDPETLIYFNNAKVATENAYAIAVVVPIRSNPTRARQILQGVAHAQNLLNQKPNGIRLRVVIVDRPTEDAQISTVAQKLAASDKLFSIIGDLDRKLAESLANFMGENCALISTTDISEDFPEMKMETPYFFRTTPSHTATTMALSRYLWEQEERWKVAVFYNSRSPESIAMVERFEKNFPPNDRRDVRAFDWWENPWAIEDGLDFAAQFRPEHVGIVLLADSETREEAIATISRFKQLPSPRDERRPPPPDGRRPPPPDGEGRRHRGSRKHGDLAIVGAESLYTSELKTADAKDAIVAVPWEHSCHRDSEYYREAQQLWQERDVSWETATAYDATQVAIAALKQHPKTPADLQQAISGVTFQVPGATGMVRFDDNGDRLDSTLDLVQVTPTSSGYDFAPLQCSGVTSEVR